MKEWNGYTRLVLPSGLLLSFSWLHPDNFIWNLRTTTDRNRIRYSFVTRFILRITCFKIDKNTHWEFSCQPGRSWQRKSRARKCCVSASRRNCSCGRCFAWWKWQTMRRDGWILWRFPSSPWKPQFRWSMYKFVNNLFIIKLWILPGHR